MLPRLDPGGLVEFGRVVDAGSGLLFLVLGVAVAFVRPWRRMNVAFSAFSGAFGLAWILGNIPFIKGEQVELYVVLALLPVATAGILVLAWEFPRPLVGGERRAYAAIVAFGAVATLAAVVTTPPALAFDASPIAAHAFRVVYAAFFNVGFGTLLGVLAYRAGSRDEGDVTPVTLASLAFIPYVALAAGIHGLILAAGLTGTVAPYSFTAIGLLPVLGAVTALWLRASAVRDGRDARRARNVAFATAGLTTLGAAFATLFGPETGPNNLGPLGLARACGVAVLAYAILRHQLLGIDVKVRWTISKSTVAAVFIAAFFVVSEAAQQFFGETIGSAYLGIAAAGALVFAIAPLQRVAERLAEKAVPVTRPRPQEANGLATYRRQVEIAWSDGRVDASERLLLQEAREYLGVSLDDADRIEREVATRLVEAGGRLR